MRYKVLFYGSSMRTQPPMLMSRSHDRNVALDAFAREIERIIVANRGQADRFRFRTVITRSPRYRTWSLVATNMSDWYVSVMLEEPDDSDMDDRTKELRD